MAHDSPEIVRVFVWMPVRERLAARYVYMRPRTIADSRELGPAKLRELHALAIC
jgi:hypothetical protein